MQFLQRKRKYFALLFQVVIVFFVFFSASVKPDNQVNTNQHTKTFCISPASSVVIRGATEQLFPSLSLLDNQNLLEKIWQSAELMHTAIGKSNAALKISIRIYNCFYALTTIHAP